MANDNSDGGSGDTPESLRAEREDLEATAACMRQMARGLEAVAERRKSFDVERFASFLQTKGPDMRIRVWAGIRSPEGFQWYKEWMARKKALMEQILQHLATFVQAAILWEEDLERRERHANVPPALGLLAPSGLGNEISAPIIGGGAADAEATGSVLTGASALSAAAAGAAVAAAGAVIYGAYKGAAEPGLKAWSDAANVRQAQLAREIYDADHNPDAENTPQKGYILYPGERRWEDGTIRLSNGQIVVDANGNSRLSNDEREKIGDAYQTAAAGGNNPFLDGLTPQPGSRGTGISRAKMLEVQLVLATGAGTLDWTPSEMSYIRENYMLPRNIIGHHINNVAKYPNWAGDPRNIQFVRDQSENLSSHGGHFHNPTVGPLIDRAAMIRKTTGKDQ